MVDSNIVKVQIELYNEIKKNGSARTLRAALWRFGLLSHMIRPTRGKAYVSNLIPCIVNITHRSEEAVIETLSQSLPLIMKALGPFMTDNDVKVNYGNQYSLLHSCIFLYIHFCRSCYKHSLKMYVLCKQHFEERLQIWF